uniref:Uncharacterized protein n=1 Tax=Arundo donax TaxID=35708 RepID=A0A0A9CNU8_ARUDO
MNVSLQLFRCVASFYRKDVSGVGLLMARYQGLEKKKCISVSSFFSCQLI